MRNSTDKFESPFRTRPATRTVVADNGGISFAITPRTLTPLRAKCADFCAIASALLVVCDLLMRAFSHQQPLPWLLAVLPAYWISRFLLERLFRFWFKIKSEVVFTREKFLVRRLLGWKAYDRQLPHTFLMIPHDHARREQEKHDLEVRKAQARGKIVAPRRYYQESFHVCLNYAGHRVDILTVFDRKDAAVVLARLQACDEAVDIQLRKGNGVAFTPEDQWGTHPGEIPESV